VHARPGEVRRSKMRAKGGKGVSIAVGSIFAVCGLILLAVGGEAGRRKYSILKSWPTVEAEVAKSRVTHYADIRTDRFGRVRRGRTMYQAKIDFQYTVRDKPFVTPSTTSYATTDYVAMKLVADNYAPGTRHIIRYNPADPNDIRFDAGYNFGFFVVPLVLGGMGAIFSGLGVGLLVSSRSVQSLRCPSCGQRLAGGQNFCPNCATPVQMSGPQLSNSR